jgi:putative transposase
MPGYDHLLRLIGATQLVKPSFGANFRRCYRPEYISGKLMEWAENQGIALNHIQPAGKPQQNAYGSTNTSSKVSRRHRNSPSSGYGRTKMNGPIWASAASHPHRN